MIAPFNLPARIIQLTLPPLSLKPRLRQLLLVVVLIILSLVIAWLPLPQIILLFGGAVFLTFLLIKPLLGLFLLIPLIPVSSLFAVSVGGVRVGLMETILIFGLVAWLLKVLTGHNIRPGQDAPPHDQSFFPRKAVLLWPFLLFLGGVGLSWLKALSIGASLVETIKWVEMLLLYLFVVALLPVRHIKWVVGLILLTGMVQAAVGLYQFIFKVGPEGFLLFDGRFLRAYGTFAQPNPYGGYLGLILPLALALALWGLTNFQLQIGTRAASKLITFMLFGLPFGLLLAALFATQSRSAWLGFGAAAVVVLVLNSKKTAVVVASFVLAGAIIALVGTFDVEVVNINTTYGAVIQRLVDAASILRITDISTIEVTDENFATIDRLAHWQAAREMWRDNLWLGIGFGNYAVVYPAYAVGRWLDPLGHAHNYLLNIGAETGLSGILMYLIFWIFSFRVLWQAGRRNHGFERAVALGGLGIMVHLHIHNLFDNLYVQGMYLHLAIILAVVSVMYQDIQFEEETCQC